MYAEKELKEATKIIRQIARKHQVSEEQVRSDMAAAIIEGKNNPDPTVQARWATFCFSGKEPTVEEFILWAASLTEDMSN